LRWLKLGEINSTLNKIYAHLSTSQKLHIAKYRGISYISHINATFEAKRGRTCPLESSYDPMSRVIYIKSCKGLALWILDMTLFCSLLLDLHQTDANVNYFFKNVS